MCVACFTVWCQLTQQEPALSKELPHSGGLLRTRCSEVQFGMDLVVLHASDHNALLLNSEIISQICEQPAKYRMRELPQLAAHDKESSQDS